MVALGLVLNPAVCIRRGLRRAVMGEVKLAIPSMYEEIVPVADTCVSSLARTQCLEESGLGML